MKAVFPIIVLAVCGGILFLSGLGRFTFKDYDEAFYAKVSDEMIASQNYMYFTHYGDPWLDKPPLLFWLIGMSVQVFGFTEFALRLPGALMGLGTVLLVYAFAHALTGNRRIALLSASILLTTSQFVYSAREVRFDVPVSFAILIATYAFFRGWQKPMWYVGTGIAIASAILFKSVFVVCIPILFFIFSFVYREWRWVRQPLFWISSIVGLLLALPWHIAQYRRYGDVFFSTYLGRHGFDRYVDAFLGARNESPLYFLALAGKLLEPWFVLFVVGCFWILAQRKQVRRALLFQPLCATLASVAVIVGLLSFSKSKLFYYFDPIYPFFALFLGLCIFIWYERVKPKLHTAFLGVLAFLFVLGLVNTIWQIFEIREWPRGKEYAIAEDEREISDVLNRQTISRKLYTIIHFSWNTIGFYTRIRAEPIEIAELKNTLDEEAFFLLIPTDILGSIELSSSILDRAEIIFEGEALTLFSVRAAS